MSSEEQRKRFLPVDKASAFLNQPFSHQILPCHLDQFTVLAGIFVVRLIGNWSSSIGCVFRVILEVLAGIFVVRLIGDYSNSSASDVFRAILQVLVAILVN